MWQSMARADPCTFYFESEVLRKSSEAASADPLTSSSLWGEWGDSSTCWPRPPARGSFAGEESDSLERARQTRLLLQAGRDTVSQALIWSIWGTFQNSGVLPYECLFLLRLSWWTKEDQFRNGNAEHYFAKYLYLHLIILLIICYL